VALPQMHHRRPQVFAKRRSRFHPPRRFRLERRAAARAGPAPQDDAGDHRRCQRDLDVVVHLARALRHPREVRGAMRAPRRTHVLHRGRIVTQGTMRARMAPARPRRGGRRVCGRVRLRPLRRRHARIPRGLLRPPKPGPQRRDLRPLPLDLSVLGAPLAAQVFVLGPQSTVLRLQSRVLVLHLLQQNVPDIRLQDEAGGHVRHAPLETPAPSRLQSPETHACPHGRPAFKRTLGAP
jgi:hypothetical protein